MKECANCDRVFEDCSRKQVRECLIESICPHCGSGNYGYPYGKEESRHCHTCGAEWPVYK